MIVLGGKQQNEEQTRNRLIVVMLLISGLAPDPKREAIALDWILSKFMELQSDPSFNIYRFIAGMRRFQNFGELFY